MPEPDQTKQFQVIPLVAPCRDLSPRAPLQWLALGWQDLLANKVLSLSWGLIIVGLLAGIKLGKDFMLSHGYMKNDVDVEKWAAPEFLEQAAKELVEERWKKVTSEKLPEPSEMQASTRLLG